MTLTSFIGHFPISGLFCPIYSAHIWPHKVHPMYVGQSLYSEICKNSHIEQSICIKFGLKRLNR